MFFTISFPLFGTQLRFDLIDHFDPIIAIYSPQITLFKDKSSLPCKILCSVLLSGLQQIIIDPTEIPRNTCSFIVNKNILLCFKIIFSNNVSIRFVTHRETKIFMKHTTFLFFIKIDHSL